MLMMQNTHARNHVVYDIDFVMTVDDYILFNTHIIIFILEWNKSRQDRHFYGILSLLAPWPNVLVRPCEIRT